MNEYETVYILQPDLVLARHIKLRDKVYKILGDHGAQVLLEKDWGKRKLAYRLHAHFFGHYFYFHYQGNGMFIPELERTLKYEEDVIRFLTVKLRDGAHLSKLGEPKRISQPEEMKLKLDEGRPSWKDGDNRRSKDFEDEGDANAAKDKKRN